MIAKLIRAWRTWNTWLHKRFGIHWWSQSRSFGWGSLVSISRYCYICGRRETRDYDRDKRDRHGNFLNVETEITYDRICCKKEMVLISEIMELDTRCCSQQSVGYLCKECGHHCWYKVQT